MITHGSSHRDDRISGVFLRAIGALAIATRELEQLRTADVSENASWHEFAEHLLQSSQAVVEGASGTTFAGNTIAILREGVRVPIELDYIERLSIKIQRHVRVGRALGLTERDEQADDSLSRTA